MKTRRDTGRSAWPLAVTLVCLLIILAGCGTKEAVKKQSEEEALRERVTAFWDHKLKREFDKSYAFEDPFFRKNISESRYVQDFRRSKAMWVAAEPVTITIEGDNASVEMKIRVRFSHGSSNAAEHDTVLKEKWTKVDNVWYHLKK